MVESLPGTFIRCFLGTVNKPFVMLSRVHYTFWKPSDLRDIAIAYDGVGLTHVFFVDQRNQVEIEHPKWIEVPESDLDKVCVLHNYEITGNYVVQHAILRSAVSQLEEYFEGKRAKFQLPLNPKGTPFQKVVQQAHAFSSELTLYRWCGRQCKTFTTAALPPTKQSQVL